jgi:hypothetical protein
MADRQGYVTAPRAAVARERPRMQCEFGGDVEGHSAKRRCLSEGRTDIDDAVPSCFHHAFAGVFAQRNRRADVDVEMLIVGFVGLLKNWTVVCRSGVFDEDVQPAVKLPAEDGVRKPKSV